MKAIIYTGSGMMHGNEIKFEAGIDSTGPYVQIDTGNSKHHMTSDDIMASEHFMVVRFAKSSGYSSLAGLWEHMHNATYVFEAGIDMDWDGTMREELFTTFAAAEKYTKQLQDSEQKSIEGYDVEVFIYARELKS